MKTLVVAELTVRHCNSFRFRGVALSSHIIGVVVTL